MSHDAAQPLFADLLRAFRKRAGLSQGDLAERAALSTAAVGVLERGVRRAPQRETVALLARALELSPAERHTLERCAARARTRTKDPAPLPTLRVSAAPTSLIGREQHVEAIARELAVSRFVTIVGTGGVGKTRLALEIARSRPELGAPLAFADFGLISDGSFVLATIAAAMGDPVAPTSIDALARRIGTRPVLCILDNCEHVLAEAAAAASALVRNCPGLRLIATSRERLAVSHEVVYRLPALPFPLTHVADAVSAESFAAIRLFAERARQVDPQFRITADNAPVVSDICRQIDGIPLAIELAATRLPELGLAALGAGLREALAQATIARDLPARQRTMQTTIAWSYELLAPHERTLFRRLAVFAGSFTLEAAADVCGSGGPFEPNPAMILSSLTAKSLVDVAGDAEPPRYRLLESVRSYADGLLRERGEHSAVARRHAAWLANFAERLSSSGIHAQKRSWTQIVYPEFDNVRAALEWALSSPERSDALYAARILGRLRSMWVQVGRRQELQRWVVAALERTDEAAHPLLAARLYWALIYASTGNVAIEAAQRATQLFERGGDARNAAHVQGQLAWEYCRRGRTGDAQRTFAWRTSSPRRPRSASAAPSVSPPYLATSRAKSPAASKQPGQGRCHVWEHSLQPRPSCDACHTRRRPLEARCPWFSPRAIDEVRDRRQTDSRTGHATLGGRPAPR